MEGPLDPQRSGASYRGKFHFINGSTCAPVRMAASKLERSRVRSCAWQTRHAFQLGTRRNNFRGESFMEIIRRIRACAVATLDACGAFEWVALSYLGFSGLLMILFRKNLPRAAHLLEIHAIAVALIFALVISARYSLTANWGQGQFGRILRVIRDWYPQAVFLFCFEELGTL